MGMLECGCYVTRKIFIVPENAVLYSLSVRLCVCLLVRLGSLRAIDRTCQDCAHSCPSKCTFVSVCMRTGRRTYMHAFLHRRVPAFVPLERLSVDVIPVERDFALLSYSDGTAVRRRSGLVMNIARILCFGMQTGLETPAAQTSRGM